jgi:hypothetical protein
VADGWCWFVLREEYCWLIAGGWFVVKGKHCWLVADKPSEQGEARAETKHMTSVLKNMLSFFSNHMHLLVF